MARVRRQGFARALDYRGGARIGLQTAPTTTAALPGVGEVDAHMAELRAMAVLALHYQVANDDAAAHAGAERVQDHAVHVLAGSHPEFAISRRVRVVLKGSRQLKGV